MSVGRPMFSSEQSTCPKCGAVQQSPGSTVCEVCGADLMLPQATKPSPPRAVTPIKQRFQLPRFRMPSLRMPSLRVPTRALAGAPATMLRRLIAALRWSVSLILQVILRLVLVTLKGAAVLVAVAGLVIGLSYVPQVRARVPAMKDVSGFVEQWLPRAQDLARPLLARVGIKIPPTRRTSSPAGSARNPAAAKPAASTPATARPAVVSVMVKSTPSEATVLLNTRRAGKTPMTLRLRPGTYKVTVSRPGYLSVTRTVVVKAGQPASLTVTLPTAP